MTTRREKRRRDEELSEEAYLRRRGLTPVDGRRVIGVATTHEARREREREERARAARLRGDA